MYDKELKIAIAAVKNSEKTFRKYFGTRTKIEIKDGDYRNVASHADRKIEHDIKSFLSKYFPDYGFLGEEHGHFPASSAYCWILDPVDGTNNYLQGHPECVISLCLQKNGKAVLSAVYAPVLNELYTAVAGKGAKCNGRRIRISEKNETKTSFGALAWSRDIKFGIKMFSQLIPQVLTLRIAGSSTYAHCSLAKGTYDFIVGKGQPSVWDIAAGELIIKEAGGTVINLNHPRILIAANRVLAAKLFKLFK